MSAITGHNVGNGVIANGGGQVICGAPGSDFGLRPRKPHTIELTRLLVSGKVVFTNFAGTYDLLTRFYRKSTSNPIVIDTQDVSTTAGTGHLFQNETVITDADRFISFASAASDYIIGSFQLSVASPTVFVNASAYLMGRWHYEV